MNFWKKQTRLGLIGLCLMPSVIIAREVVLENNCGRDQTFQVSHSDSFNEVMDYIVSTMPDGTERLDSSISMNLYVVNDRIHVRAAKADNDFRNYSAPLTQNDLDDIHFILNTMAKSSLASLATQRTSLKKAGDRIDHLHPYRFLETIFTDEQLKANIAAVSKRSFVWKEFLSGTIGSLEDENKSNNLTQTQLQDFCNKVGINITVVQPLIQKQKWKEFISKLIEIVPRSGDPGRYDM